MCLVFLSHIWGQSNPPRDPSAFILGGFLIPADWHIGIHMGSAMTRAGAADRTVVVVIDTDPRAGREAVSTAHAAWLSQRAGQRLGDWYTRLPQEAQ